MPRPALDPRSHRRRAVLTLVSECDRWPCGATPAGGAVASEIENETRSRARRGRRRRGGTGRPGHAGAPADAARGRRRALPGAAPSAVPGTQATAGRLLAGSPVPALSRGEGPNSTRWLHAIVSCTRRRSTTLQSLISRFAMYFAPTARKLTACEVGRGGLNRRHRDFQSAR